MDAAVGPDRRPGLSVMLRAIVLGALLGALAGVALVLGDPTNVGDAVILTGTLCTAAAVGAGVAALSSTGWLLAVRRGPPWMADATAALVAAAPFVLLWLVAQATILLIVALLVGVVAGVAARWQGWERGPRRARPTPTSSPRAG